MLREQIADLLLGLNDEAVIVIAPETRKVMSAIGDKVQDLKDAVAEEFAPVNNDNGFVTLTPDAGQTGISLAFTKNATGLISQELTDVTDAIVTPVKPKRSVSAIVSAIR